MPFACVSGTDGRGYHARPADHVEKVTVHPRSAIPYLLHSILYQEHMKRSADQVKREHQQTAIKIFVHSPLALRLIDIPARYIRDLGEYRNNAHVLCAPNRLCHPPVRLCGQERIATGHDLAQVRDVSAENECVLALVQRVETELVERVCCARDCSARVDEGTRAVFPLAFLAHSVLVCEFVRVGELDACL